MDADTCVDCSDWYGCCRSGERERRLRYNHFASSEACEKFKPRRQQNKIKIAVS